MEKIKPCYVVGAAALAIGFAIRYKARNEKPLTPEQRITQLDEISFKDMGNIVILGGIAMLIYGATKK